MSDRDHARHSAAAIGPASTAGRTAWLRTRRAQENIVALLLLVVFGGVIWLCQDFGPRARMIPLPLAILGIVLTIMQILWQNLRSTDELQMDLIAVEKPARDGADDLDAPATAHTAADEQRPAWLKELRAYGIIASLVGLVFLIGIIPAVFAFTAGYFMRTGRYSWLMGLSYTSAFTAAVYLLFIAALQIEPYHGLLTPLFEHLR